ncbi:PH domain-containing protein [Variovorax ureilyticus]|uniref:PH domain-containing protein n=1 Tax=Variovorax ureilyticus TaxID=1836198 RepID=UPI003D665F46
MVLSPPEEGRNGKGWRAGATTGETRLAWRVQATPCSVISRMIFAGTPTASDIQDIAPRQQHSTEGTVLMQFQDIGVKSFATLFAILAIGPIVAGMVLQRQAGSASHIAIWSILAIGVLTLAVIGFSMLNRSVTIRDAHLTVKSSFYSIDVPLASITDVREVTPGSADDAVGFRVNGVGLPGFRSGWFNSRAGGRLFVDRITGPYLLVDVDGKPRLALEFSDNHAAAKALTITNAPTS